MTRKDLIAMAHEIWEATGWKRHQQQNSHQKRVYTIIHSTIVI